MNIFPEYPYEHLRNFVQGKSCSFFTMFEADQRVKNKRVF